MKKTKILKVVKDFDIESHSISCDASHRGGTLKVDVSELFEVENAIMGAYQNYLGGGLRGAIVGGAMFEPSELSEKEQKVFYQLKEKIKHFFYCITNDAEMNDEWTALAYDKQQSMPVSAY